MEPIDSTTIVKLAYSPSLETGDEEFEKIRAEKLARLRQIVKNKLKGNPKAEQALTMLERETGAELATIKTYLDTELERDPDFSEEFKRLGAEIIEHERHAQGQMMAHVMVDMVHAQPGAIGEFTEIYLSLEKQKDQSPVFQAKASGKNAEEENPRIEKQPQELLFTGQSVPLTHPRQENIWERGNKLIAFMAGGAFIGGIIAQAPGAIIGAILSAIYASFVQIEMGEHDSH